MIHQVTIGGREVELAWNQDIASRYPFRASKIGGAPNMADFTNPKKAAAAVTSLLWLVLPPAVHSLYQTPEDLYVAIDHANEAKVIHAALLAIVSEMAPVETEKKSTSKTRRSPKSNSV